MNEKVENARVLVVEDQEFEADKIVETLTKDNDSVIPVDSGVKAMELVSQHEFDLMIVSLNLKREDGLRLCSHLRSNEKTRATPIVMIGTDEDMTRIAHGLEIGAHDYIMRPVDRNELLARCRTQIRRRRFQERLKSTYEISLSMALTDTLTGLYNRRYLEAHMQKLLLKSHENKKNLGVLYLGIDHFKNINDTYGHTVGDEILKTFAFRLKDNLRGFDMVARIGGEEFVALLPDIGDEMALVVAERLRRAIADKPIPCNAPEGALSITTSIGGAIIRGDDYGAGPYNIHTVLNRADQSLYAAKDSGRNCTVFEHLGKLDPEKFIQEPRRVIE
jgi:two-component system cell cycle response regulator